MMLRGPAPLLKPVLMPEPEPEAAAGEPILPPPPPPPPRLLIPAGGWDGQPGGRGRRRRNRVSFPLMGARGLVANANSGRPIEAVAVARGAGTFLQEEVSMGLTELLSVGFLGTPWAEPPELAAASYSAQLIRLGSSFLVAVAFRRVEPPPAVPAANSPAQALRRVVATMLGAAFAVAVAFRGAEPPPAVAAANSPAQVLRRAVATTLGAAFAIAVAFRRAEPPPAVAAANSPVQVLRRAVATRLGAAVAVAVGLGLAVRRADE